jgi:hypothetical protein
VEGIREGPVEASGGCFFVLKHLNKT